MQVRDFLPDADQLLAQSPSRLAHTLLSALHAEKRNTAGYVPGAQPPPQVDNYALHEIRTAGYEPAKEADVRMAVREAWAWMQRELILVPAEGQPVGFFSLSRFGRDFLRDTDPLVIDARRLVDVNLLHSSLHSTSVDSFWRGEYDVSVFVAFRQVEIAVREAGGFLATQYGIQLMRQAFAAQTGPLSDTSKPLAEQEATSSLFAGAIGLYKNANGHRAVGLTAKTAAELLVFASHLLEIIDERRQAVAAAQATQPAAPNA